tara:strand:+ start:2189 stop:2725 length:537 start_codon:yes stop_codon:yes gene_type:complete
VNELKFFQNIAHLNKRFWVSLNPEQLPEEDLDWVRSQLSENEFAHWERLPLADQSHSFQVAKQTQSLIGGQEKSFIAAALLHDIGKLESGFGTFGRVFATVFCFFYPPTRMEKWQERDKGLRRRLLDYSNHPSIGAKLLNDLDSQQETIAWVLEHHSEKENWVTPKEIGEALSSADND